MHTFQRLSMSKVLVTSLLIASSFSVFARGPAVAEETSPILAPWMTGPLLAPAGHTIPAGHVNFEPYFFITDDFGTYNNAWNVTTMPSLLTYQPDMVLSYGLSKHFDLQASIPYSFNTEEGQSSNGISDSSLILGFQALESNPHGIRPDLRVTLAETFPFGRYKNLNPIRLGTDVTGSGSFQTSFGLNFQKTTQFSRRFLRSRLSLIYTVPSSVHVNGVNAYGGALNTDGKVHLGNKFTADLGFEYTLTQQWVPALDVVYTTSDASSFSGNLGSATSNSSGSGMQFSIAPAIEYNFSANLGLIVGAWFSVAGHNATDFDSYIIAINYYH